MHEFECGSCGNVFVRNEALCTDWQNPAKKFICPTCNTGLRQLSVGELLKTKQFWLAVGPFPLVLAFTIVLFSALANVVGLLVMLALMMINIVLVYIFSKKLNRMIKPIKLNAHRATFTGAT
ncbi:MAG: hypothetical protein HOC70_07495 [Gammaproteobacteria bacterium]|jgi:hypothetical protein|nr:hypothetical protein [Gammaproteobacteria bacterium]MBT4493073.1 hypothetical protein [Gammaproteobacteria bacterium]